jgi:hypothetical protein
MKKIMNKVSFAVVGLMASSSAFAAKAGAVGKSVSINDGMCELLVRLQGVFNILRIMAFIGAAFYIAGWAWEFISKGEAKLDDVKKRGIGLLIGFSLLFLVGIVLSFVMSASGLNIIGCGDILKKW